MLISDETILRQVLSAFDDENVLNNMEVHADGSDEDSCSSSGSGSSDDSDDSSIKHLTLHQKHEIVVDKQDYEDKALYKYKNKTPVL